MIFDFLQKSGSIGKKLFYEKNILDGCCYHSCYSYLEKNNSKEARRKDNKF